VIGFIIRLVGYALLLGGTSRIAEALWSQQGLDAVAALQPFHDTGLTALLVAPIGLALIGFGSLRAPCIFVAFFLAGAALTAPFTIARVVGL
jgi:hypothetical protein